MSDSAILRVLQQAVRDHAVPQSIAPTLPVKYIDITFTVPNTQKYLELVHIPNNRNGDFWGVEKNHRGLFRMILHWPKNGTGPYTPIETIESIAGYFKTNRLLDGVQIYEAPDFTGSLDMGQELLYPMGLRYQSYRRT